MVPDVLATHLDAQVLEEAVLVHAVEVVHDKCSAEAAVPPHSPHRLVEEQKTANQARDDHSTLIIIIVCGQGPLVAIVPFFEIPKGWFGKNSQFHDFVIRRFREFQDFVASHSHNLKISRLQD